MSLRDYLTASREPRYTVLFALPLLLLYEVSAALISGSAVHGVRNGADVMLKTVFIVLGGQAGLVVFGAVLIGAGAWIVWRDHRKRGGGRLDKRIFLGSFAESLVYAAIFGQVVALLTAQLLYGPSLAMVQGTTMTTLPLGTQLVVSLGAGIYEELLFRVLLVSALLALGLKAGWSRPVSVAFAVIVGALIFAVFHYVGPYGDPLELSSFTFRTIAGLALSGLYVARGFGITAWTHALYDVGLALLAV
jgi:hypothetical protein